MLIIHLPDLSFQLVNLLINIQNLLLQIFPFFHFFPSSWPMLLFLPVHIIQLNKFINIIY